MRDFLAGVGGLRIAVKSESRRGGRKTILFALVALSATQASADDNNVQGAMGSGMETCGKFAQRYGQNTVVEEIYFQWAQGFMTAINAVASGWSLQYCLIVLIWSRVGYEFKSLAVLLSAMKPARRSDGFASSPQSSPIPSEGIKWDTSSIPIMRMTNREVCDWFGHKLATQTDPAISQCVFSLHIPLFVTVRQFSPHSSSFRLWRCFSQCRNFFCP